MKTQWKLPGFSLDLSTLVSPSEKEALLASLSAAHASHSKKVSGLGFYNLPTGSGDVMKEVQKTADSIRANFDAAAILGIGGSYLGGASCVEALGKNDFPLIWVSNIDPPSIQKAEKALRKKTALVVVSKSGNTTETLAAFYHLSENTDPKGYVVITDPDSGELRSLVKQHRWASLPVPSNVGGRFSVLTPVGLLPAALAGVPLEELLGGAAQMREQLDSLAKEENPAFLLATLLHLWDRVGHGTQYLMPYWENMKLFAAWWVQLWGESLGKVDRSGKAVGPTPVAALGTTDQHSLLQLFKEGPKNKVIGFLDIHGLEHPLKVGEPGFSGSGNSYLCRHSFDAISRLAAAATQTSLTNSLVPTYRIEVPVLNARALGALYFFFEVATSFAGELYEVNAFDQPGVEESKRLLHASLS